MYKTERKYWLNGKTVHGGGTFWTYSFAIGNYGIMICKPSRDVNLINVYKLI